MDALTALQQRVSIPRLMAPAPNSFEVEQMIRAALRAADHGKLQPWRFLIIEGEGLSLLSHVYLDASLKANPEVSASVLEKCRTMTSRAPMIIVSILKSQESSKVPYQEQLLAGGAATQNMLNAIFALGYGGVWRTGELAYNSFVKESLGLAANESILGFIYVGTPAQEAPKPPSVVPRDFFKSWPDK